MTRFVPEGVSPLPWVTHLHTRQLWHESSPGVGGPDPHPPEGESHADFDYEADLRFAAHAANTHEALCECVEEFEKQLMDASRQPHCEDFATIPIMRRARALLEQCKQP